MLTKLGALSLGANVILSVPTGITPINLGTLSTFAMWSSAGAVSDVVSSSITGNVGTALGALTIAGIHTGVQYPAGTTSTSTITTATYSIYQNGTEVINSRSRINLESSVISLEAMVTTLTAGEVIEIRWKVDFGEASLDNRILSLIRSGY
jgi:autotransporter adhesin